MQHETKNKQGGFIEVILLIIVALLIMKYMGLTVSEVVNWIIGLFHWFVAFFASVLK